MMNTITLTMPLDMHVHLRDADMLKIVAPLTSYTFSGAIVMPNLVPPVTTIEAVKEYRHRPSLIIFTGDKGLGPPRHARGR